MHDALKCALFQVFRGHTFEDIAVRIYVYFGIAIDSQPQVRNSIRALFPERDCFTLVRPLNDEKELQKLDQIPVSWKHACL